jgi:hypothetical protein
MARNDGRIEKGQRLSSAISARAWNRAQQAADIVLGSQPGISSDGQVYSSAPYQWVYVKNSTGSDVARWGVMAISGMEIIPSYTPGNATSQFEQMPVLTGSVPTSTTTAWCVAVEPIKDGKIGRVAVSGVVQVKVDVKSANDTAVRAKSGYCTELETGSGEGLVLWKDSGTGSGKWALVRIGVASLSMHLCKNDSATWTKGSARTLDIWEAGTCGSESGSTIGGLTAWNLYADIPANKFCSVARHGNGCWYVIAAECD